MNNFATNSNKSQLNRSVSFSGSPISQRICMQEAFDNDGKTLIRQYSCERIYDKSQDRSIFKQSIFKYEPPKINVFDQNTDLKLDKLSITDQSDYQQFNSDTFNFTKDCPEQENFEKSLNENKQKQENTPMDVDTSTEADKSMSDVHGIKTHQNKHQRKVPKLLVPNKPRNLSLATDKTQMDGPKMTKYLKTFLKGFVLLFLPLSFAYLLKTSDDFLNGLSSSDTMNINNITDALDNFLYGQDDVVAKIKSNLNLNDDKQLYLFTGGVGVGKTYTANLISNNFPWRNNIQKFTSPQHKLQSSQLIKNLNTNGYNLLIIDSINASDEVSVINLIKKLYFTSTRKIITILIFNVHEQSLDTTEEKALNSFSADLSRKFKEANLKPNLVIFKKLTENDVKKCIRYEISKAGLILNDRNIEYVLKNVNFEYSGCKGVHSKVALLS